METKNTSRNLPWLAILSIVWNTFDIALHVYVELVEPLRVAGNVAAIAAAVIVLLGLARNYAPHVLGLTAALFIGFNVVESILHGFFVPSLVFISISVFLLLRWAQGEWHKANPSANDETGNPIYLRWRAAILVTLIGTSLWADFRLAMSESIRCFFSSRNKINWRIVSANSCLALILSS